MEEDSVTRRERLIALRSEASQGAGSPVSRQTAELPDPLFSPSPAPTEERARFDYYTNPSAAFSGSYAHNKKKMESFASPSSSGYTRPNVDPRNYTPPSQSPMHQFQPPFYPPPHPQWRSPVQFQPSPSRYRPYSTNRPGPWNSRPMNSYTHPSRGGFNNPNPNPNFIRGCRPSTNQSFSPSTNPNPNPKPNFHSGSRGRGGRGSGFNNQFNPDDYYKKSMVEDPWIELEPIVGKLVEPVNGSGSHSWVPESVRKMESKKLDQGGSSNNNKYEKKLSLAEYLDQSFNQAIDEA